jgi:hypothetical protein
MLFFMVWSCFSFVALDGLGCVIPVLLLWHWSCSFPIVLCGLGHVLFLLFFMALVMFFCCCFELIFIVIICGLGCAFLLQTYLFCSSIIVLGCFFFSFVNLGYALLLLFLVVVFCRFYWSCFFIVALVVVFYYDFSWPLSCSFDVSFPNLGYVK